MDKESDVIRDQMEHTRAALTDKLELLEQQVSETVMGTAETVEKVRQTVHKTVSGAANTVANVQHCIEDTVQTIRESVRETAESISETLDVRKQVERHPWAMMAGATAVGFGVGILVSQADTSPARSIPSSPDSSGSMSDRNSLEGGGSRLSSFPQSKRRERNGRTHSQEPRDQAPWEPALNQLKGLAIGAMFGVVRELLSQSLPSALTGQVGEVINDFAASLGGKPITGKLLPETKKGVEESQESHEAKATSMPTPQGRHSGSSWPRQTAMSDDDH